MDDTKLLELAGRAAGEEYGPENNPLDRDDLALRLAVKLRMDVVHFESGVRADVTSYDDCHEDNGSNPYAATRRAIVRAAAAIGEQMP